MRVLLKLSGQVLKGSQSIIDRDYLSSLAEALRQAQNNGHQVAIVVGGGNLFRFDNQRSDPRDAMLDRQLADGRGMLATVFNGMWLQDMFQVHKVKSELFTSVFADKQFVQPYDQQKAKESYDSGNVVILAGGTGKPGFSTDSGAVSLAQELEIKTILKGTHTVDGIYSADPLKDTTATFFDQITYTELLERGLTIMDKSAIEKAKTEDMKIVVFSMKDPATLNQILSGKKLGSVVTNEEQHD